MNTTNKVIAIVGMAGSGKSEAAKVFEDHGYIRVRFGDITDGEMKKRGMPVCEANERLCREQLRRELGMGAYAILNQPRIDAALENANVVADGLYSWEEYLALKKYYGARFGVVAVYASPRIRYARLAGRPVRPLNAGEAASRDQSEIENLNKGGPIVMADYTLNNETTLPELRRQTEIVLSRLATMD
jgi:dephospho-CoA kinase